MYNDQANDSKGTAKVFTGLRWRSLGPAGFTHEAASELRIDFGSSDTPFVAYKAGGGPDGVPHVAYRSPAAGQGATVLKFQ